MLAAAVKDSDQSGGPQLPLGPGKGEVLYLAPIMGRSKSAPASESSLGPSSPGSPHHSDRDFSVGSTSHIVNPDDIQLPHVPHLSAPLTFTHSRITSTHFAGAPRRSRSPSPLPHSHGFLQSTTLESAAAPPSLGHSRPSSPLRPPSPSLFPEPHPFLQPSVPDVVISPPSGPETAETVDADSFPPSPVSVQEEHSSQFPPGGAEYLTPDTSYPGQGDARRSSESLRPPPLNRAPPSFPFPLVYKSQVTLNDIPFVDPSWNGSDGKKRHIGLMHSEQVSRYVNKGAV
jgi:hypothetical protein